MDVSPGVPGCQPPDRSVSTGRAPRRPAARSGLFAPPDTAGPAGSGRPRLLRSGRTAPPGCPDLGVVLSVARAENGRTWAVPLSRADPVLLTAGLSMEAGGDLDARTAGSLHLPDADVRDQLGTEIVSVLACPMRLLWADPDDRTVRSHVPAFLAVEVDDQGRRTVTVVDVVLTDALANPLAPPYEVVACLAEERGWRSELLCGVDEWLVRGEIMDAVLGAQDGLVSNRLWTACVLEAPTFVILDSITTPGDLVALLTLLRDQRLDALAPAADRSVRP